jgi:hypothetical protein
LFDVLRYGDSFTELRRNHPDLLTWALHRSREKIDMAASEWKAFLEEYFIHKGLPVPDSPQYVEIQEALEIYRRSQFERAFQKLKRIVRQRWDVLFDKRLANSTEGLRAEASVCPS